MIGFPLSEDELDEKRIASLLWHSYPILVSELWDSAEKQRTVGFASKHTLTPWLKVLISVFHPPFSTLYALV